MDRKTGRFLLLEALAILVIFLMGQFYMYPIRGQAQLEKYLEKSTAVLEPRTVLKADLESSVVYILEISGYYCEKMFDKSLIFDRYVEKPLVLLREKASVDNYEFVTKDSAKNFLFSINAKEEMVVSKNERNDSLKMVYAALTMTLILLGLCFGTGSKKKKPRSA